MRVKYVKFLYPGTFFNEESLEVRTTDDPNAIEIPKGAYAFCFLERTEVEQDGEKLLGSFERDDRTFYVPGGRVLTLAEIKAGAIEGDCDILISNMEINGWDRVIETNRGNVQPFEEHCVLLGS